MENQYKEKKSTKQQENAYIIYMMLSSFFQKAVCMTKHLEKTLFLYYKDLSAEKQVNREAEILKELEKKFAQQEKILEQSTCEVYLQNLGEEYRLLFAAKNYHIRIVVNNKGEYQII